MFIRIAESDSHEEKAPYRLVMLKQRFPALTVKTIVRIAVKCVILTIVDSHGFLVMVKKSLIPSEVGIIAGNAEIWTVRIVEDPIL